MNRRYTAFAKRNFVLSLIPVFPILTLYPAVGLTEALKNAVQSCERAHKYTGWILIILIGAALLVHFTRKVEALPADDIDARNRFRVFCLLYYSLANSLVFFMLLGPINFCRGDGQAILVALLTGPLAGATLLLLGFATDVRIDRFHAKQPK